MSEHFTALYILWTQRPKSQWCNVHDYCRCIIFYCISNILMTAG